MPGFNLPPGVTILPDEEEEQCPAQCINCEDADEEGNCYFVNSNMKVFGYEHCPLVAVVNNCHCGKKIGLVAGLIPKEFQAHFYETEYCCSKECKDKRQAEIDKEINEMKHDKYPLNFPDGMGAYQNN
jgi:hypothetical protein